MIQFEIKEGVGKITLNRPDKYHAFVREIPLAVAKPFLLQKHDICQVDLR